MPPDTPTPTDGAELLEDLRTTITKYVAMPSDEHTDAVVLWIATTHCLPAFDYATRLVARSAEKRSGKSRLLEIVDGTCYKPLRAVNATVAYIFRSLTDDPPPTLLLDEADTIFGSKKVAEQNEDLRGLLNAGYQRGLPFGRTVGPQHTPTEFSTFAMSALAGIGQMPDTIEDRAVVIPMRRRKPSETVRPFRMRRDMPELHAVRDQLAAWAATKLDDLTRADPDLPVEDRAADTWAPLVAVADAAGGDWPERARKAAKALTSEAAESDEAGSINLQLLGDVRTIFAENKLTFIPSTVMCEYLHRVEESPWSDWDMNPSKLGRRLREYGIKTGHNTDKTQRGYRIEDFHDAFERYLTGSEPGTRPKASEHVPTPESRGSQADTFGVPDALKASGDFKASGEIPRNSGDLTPTDTFGRDTGKQVACRACSVALHEAVVADGFDTCPSCDLESAS